MCSQGQEKKKRPLVSKKEMDDPEDPITSSKSGEELLLQMFTLRKEGQEQERKKVEKKGAAQVTGKACPAAFQGEGRGGAEKKGRRGVHPRVRTSGGT